MKDSGNIEAFIFDMDSVLYTLDLGLRLRLFAQYTGIDKTIIDNKIWQSDFESKAEQGFYSSGKSYLKAFNEILGTNIDLKTWFQIRSTSMTPIDDMLDLTRSLSKHYKIALLTNNSMLVQEGLQQKLIAPELSKIFKDNLFSSAKLKAKKPGPDVYHKVCRHLNVPPHLALMIDDKKENIIGALQAGLKGHHYLKTTDLIHDLRIQNISC